MSGYSSIYDNLERQYNLLIDKSLYSLYDFALAYYYMIGEKYRDNKGNYKLILLALPRSESFYTLAEVLVEVNKRYKNKKETTTRGDVTAALNLRDPIRIILNNT